MSNIKILVAFSGGKDSHATLLTVCDKYGADRVEAVFADTGWEHPCTVQHVHDVCDKLGCKLTIVKNDNYPNGFRDLCLEKYMFPRSMHRFCTTDLKVAPLTDYVLSLDCNIIYFQGIRGAESRARSKYARECNYFAQYFPGAGTKETKHLYRKKDVLEWCKTHDASLFRPIFDWSAQQVIDCILAHGHKPNPLYYRGATRVGCFPCIMANYKDIRLVANDPEMRQRVIDLERDVNASRVKSKKYMGICQIGIPERFCKAHPKSDIQTYATPTAEEMFAYVTRNDLDPSLFDDHDDSAYSCVAQFQGLCE